MPGGGTIPAGTAASRMRMQQWRDAIRSEATRCMDGRPAEMGPVRLFVEFALMPPQSMRKRDVGWLPHSKKPDIDKLLRALCDGLTGIVWRDDAQVSQCSINKVYAWDGITGAIVTVEPITEDAARRFAVASQHIRERVR